MQQLPFLIQGELQLIQVGRLGRPQSGILHDAGQTYPAHFSCRSGNWIACRFSVQCLDLRFQLGFREVPSEENICMERPIALRINGNPLNMCFWESFEPYRTIDRSEERRVGKECR